MRRLLLSSGGIGVLDAFPNFFVRYVSGALAVYGVATTSR